MEVSRGHFPDVRYLPVEVGPLSTATVRNDMCYQGGACKWL